MNWNSDNIKILIKMRRDGAKMKEISTVLHTTVSTVTGKLHRLGEKFKKPTLPEPMPWKDFLKLYGKNNQA